MNNAPMDSRQLGLSKRRKKKRTRFHSLRDTIQLRLNRRVRKVLYPLYKRLGLRSVLGLFIPGFRQVSRSNGGALFTGLLRNSDSLPRLIATVGDYGSGKGESHQVAQLIHDLKSGAVVTLGDNVYFETGFQTLVGNIYGDYLHEGAFFPAAGNHDYSEGRGIALFDRYFDFLGGHRWYSVLFEDVEFFILDSHQALHHQDVFDKQRDWLEQATAASAAKWKIVVSHHPPHSARARSEKKLRLPYNKWGVCMVMSGHDHTLQHLQFDGVHYVVNGVGGGSLHEFDEILEGTEFRLSGEFGAVFLEVREEELHVRFVTLPNKEVHSFSIPAP